MLSPPTGFLGDAEDDDEMGEAEREELRKATEEQRAREKELLDKKNKKMKADRETKKSVAMKKSMAMKKSTTQLLWRIVAPKKFGIYSIFNEAKLLEDVTYFM